MQFAMDELKALEEARQKQALAVKQAIIERLEEQVEELKEVRDNICDLLA